MCPNRDLYQDLLALVSRLRFSCNVPYSIQYFFLFSNRLEPLLRARRSEFFPFPIRLRILPNLYLQSHPYLIRT